MKTEYNTLSSLEVQEKMPKKLDVYAKGQKEIMAAKRIKCDAKVYWRIKWNFLVQATTHSKSQG